MRVRPQEATGDLEPGGPMRSTTELDAIVRWAAKRGGVPILIPQSRHPADVAQLSILFPGDDPNEVFKYVDWPQWFTLFEERGLCFVCRELRDDGALSRQFRLDPRRRIPHQAGASQS